MSDKMDRQGVRTAAEIEQKYNFGKSFAEVMGIATDAQEAAAKAASLSQGLDEKLTSEEIFNRLTKNGTLQGLFMGDDGEVYINADFIKSLEKLFAKDITMSGKFTYSTKTFLEPGKEEVDTIKNHLLGNVTIPSGLIPSYDFNGDGAVTILDLAKAQKASLGVASLSSWSGAKLSDVTMTIDLSNPSKLIQITGTNMWGRKIEKFVGVNYTNIPLQGQDDFIVESGTSGIWEYTKYKSGYVDMWCTADYTSGADDATFQLTVDFPFTLYPNKVFVQPNAFGWNFTRPPYVQKGTNALMIQTYLNTKAEYKYAFDVYVRGKLA